MEFNLCESAPGPSAVIRLPNLKTDEHSKISQSDEVSNHAKKANNNPDGKSTENPAQDMKQPNVSTLSGDAGCPSNFETGEATMRVQVGEVSKNIKDSLGKGAAKKPTKDQGLHQKRKQSTKRGEPPMKRAKKPDPVPTSQMVTESIKALRKRNGASMEDILQYIEVRYKANAKLIKRCVTRYLRSAVQQGTVEQLNNGDGDDSRFKIKKSEKGANKLGAEQSEVNRKNVKKVKILKVEQKSEGNQRKMKKVEKKVAKDGQESKVPQKK